MGQPFEIGVDECRELLAAGRVGRVAVCTPLGPHIVPVNYGVVEESVVLRTSPYSVLGGHARGAVLALEVDHFDYGHHVGWSVVARGRAEAVTSADELRRIRATWDPQVWADGQRNLFLRLRWSELSGRRLSAGGGLFEHPAARGTG